MAVSWVSLIPRFHCMENGAADTCARGPFTNNGPRYAWCTSREENVCCERVKIHI